MRVQSVIGPVPEHWEIWPFFATGKTVQSKNNGMREDNLLSLSYGRIVEKDIDSSEGLLPESFETYQIVQPNDMVFRFTDLQNDQRSLRSALVRDQGIITSAYLAFRPNEQVMVPRFLDYLMRAYDLSKVFYPLGGGVRQSLKFDDVKRLGVIVPPLDEQKAIADFLDRELAQIDALIADQEKMNLLFTQRVDRLILDAVTLGIENENLTSCDDAWLQRYPASWTFGRLKNCLRSSVTDGPHTTPEFVENGIPFLSVDGIQNGELVFDGCRYISNADDLEFRKKANPQAGDILMGKAASVGKIAQVKVDFPFAIWSPLALLKIDTLKFDTTFVEFFLKSAYVQAQINAISNANTQQNLGMNQIPKLRFVYPNKQEQTRIAKFLTRNIELINKQSHVSKQVIHALVERRQSLISSAVTGKIDVRKVA
jgi:type I restriction enzyme S subunit